MLFMLIVLAQSLIASVNANALDAWECFALFNILQVSVNTSSLTIVSAGVV